MNRNPHPVVSGATRPPSPEARGVIAQLLQSQSQTPLHGPERQAKALGHLRVRQPQEVAEREDLALFVGELFEGLAQQVPFEVEPGLGEGLVLPGLGTGSLDLLLRPLAARLGADVVDAAVADHGEDPGAHAAAPRPVATGRAPHLDERFLEQVLCRLPPVHEAVGQRVRRAAVAVVEQGERPRVAFDDEGDQVLVGHARVASRVVSHAAGLESLIRRVEAHRLVSRDRLEVVHHPGFPFPRYLRLARFGTLAGRRPGGIGRMPRSVLDFSGQEDRGCEPANSRTSVALELFGALRAAFDRCNPFAFHVLFWVPTRFLIPALA